jgi:hypothetical protein
MAPSGTLICVECGREAKGELGWREYLTVEEDEPAEAVLYCPLCAERELGGHAHPGRRAARPIG